MTQDAEGGEARQDVVGDHDVPRLGDGGQELRLVLDPGQGEVEAPPPDLPLEQEGVVG